MKFKVTKTSYYDSDNYEIVDFQNLEEFLEWVVKQKYKIIVSLENDNYSRESNLPKLEIYDAFRE
jgi:hypothetical protein